MVTLYATLNAFNRISAVSQYAQSDSIELSNPAVVEQPYNYRFDNGQWIEDIQPSPYHTLDAQGNWYLNNEYLQNAKDMMWQRIKSYRDEREDSGVKMVIDTVNYWFHSDTKSLIKYIFLMILSMFFASQFPNALKWKTLSGDKVALNTGIIINLFFTILNYGGVVFEVAEQHKAAMQQSTDPLNYNYLSGWPLIFGE